MKKVLRLLTLTCIAIPFMALSVLANGEQGRLGGGNADRSAFGERNAFGGERSIGTQRGGLDGRGGFGERGGFGDRGRGGFDPNTGGTTAPLSDWLPLLLVAGLALGLKRVIDRNKALRLKSIDIPE
jgi:hypothetical protein